MQGTLQLGKAGLTENFLQSLDNMFLRHSNIKISVLKSAGHDKTVVKDYAQTLLEHLGTHYTARVLGFTIFLKKWRKPVR